MVALTFPPPLRWRRSRAARDELVAFQNAQLRRLVAHAYANVPYYRRLFDGAGLTPADIRTRADLALIPITERADLQSLSTEEILARGVNPDRLVVHRTSGATGQPLTVRRTWFEELLLRAFRLRALHDLGLRVSDRRARVCLAQSAGAEHRLLRLARSAGLYRTVVIDCLQDPRRIVEQLRQYAPDSLTGFPGVLSSLAPFVDDDGRPPLRPRLVAVGGEVLTPLMRRQISDAFRAPVFDLYGSHEFNLLAWQCKESDDFHVCDDAMILEVLKDGRPARPGERGEVIGTNLRAFAMPFLRYRLGDVVTQGAEACGCGRPFATIRAVQGRMIDYFVFGDGRVMHPYELAKVVVGEHAWIRQYRLTQQREDRVLLEIVPLIPPRPEHLTELRDRARALLGPEVNFRVALLARIDVESSGKFRVSRSLVRSHYDALDWDRL